MTVSLFPIFQASDVSADILALFADEEIPRCVQVWNTQWPLNDPISRNPMDLDRENEQVTVSVPDELSICLRIADVKLL